MSHLALQLVGHRCVEAVEVPDREPGRGQVSVRVHAASLCPTDVKKWDDAGLADRLDAPLVLGHEFAGVVEAVGPGVSGARVGDRVAVDPVLRCGMCRECASGHPQDCTDLLGIGAAAGNPVRCAHLASANGITGGFEELTIVPEANLLPLPDGLDFDSAALIEPLADVMHSVETARIVEGDTAAVIGLGPMGLLHVEALKDAGVAVTGVDLREDRLEVCRKLGVDTVGPDDLGEHSVVFVVAGGGGYASALTLGLDRLARGGRIVLFSSAPTGTLFRFDVNRVHYYRQSVVGVVGFDRSHADAAILLLERGVISVDVVRSPRVALADAQHAFANATSPGVLKAAIEFGSRA